MLRSLATATAIAAAGGALVVLASPATATFINFRSPTGKIGCAASDGPTNLRCDVQQPTYPRPTQPRSCQEDYGDSFSMSARGTVRWTCHGDTTMGATKVLGYGKTWSWGPYRCTMRTTGITCNNAGGHGFTLSTQRATRW